MRQQTVKLTAKKNHHRFTEFSLTPPRGVAAWSDAQLLGSIRSDPPNEEALNVLVTRYWDTLYGRCQLLTLNQEKAMDLAQSAWCRMLQNRHALQPDRSFIAYLITIATNLFRDSYRSARRAGPMADYQLLSLDATVLSDEGETVTLESLLPDLDSFRPEQKKLLKMDLDCALKRLSPLLRDVLIGRFIDGESCAEIGLRHRRTEQTISGWIREGLRQLKAILTDR